MNYKRPSLTIQQVSENRALYFPEKGDVIKKELDSCTREEILEHLDYAGVIPERFEHDSTEEKLYAKYCDILLARSLKELGFEAETIEERGDAADIRAVGEEYSLVCDGKAFRLSRTAKNQKDFKVEALSQWKKDAEYALLVCPRYQYPGRKSQIYPQAIRYNVCMLSYTHIAFLMGSGKIGPKKLESLWDLSRHLKSGQDASPYWRAVLEEMLKLTKKKHSDWDRAVGHENERIAEQAIEQIKYWEEQKQKIKSMNQETVTNMLIDALKINGKIETISKISGL